MNQLLHLVSTCLSNLSLHGNPSLELFLSQIEKELFEVSKSNLGYSNFSKEEWQCIRLLANDRSIIIKKADKGLCVVVWDHEDYIAEVSKQLNDESVYKSVKFKDKILQDLAEKSNGIFKGLKQKCKITEKQLKYFTIEHKKLPIWGKCICFPKSIKGCMIFLEDQLYQIVENLKKRPQNFWITSLGKLCRMGGLILRSPTIS